MCDDLATTPALLVDEVWWVADATREALSRFDFGQFRTLHGFVDPKSKKFETGGAARGRRMIAEEGMFAVPHDEADFDMASTFLITMSGTICPRKRQGWVVNATAQLLRDDPKAQIAVIVVGGLKWTKEYDDGMTEA